MNGILQITNFDKWGSYLCSFLFIVEESDEHCFYHGLLLVVEVSTELYSVDVGRTGGISELDDPMKKYHPACNLTPVYDM